MTRSDTVVLADERKVQKEIDLTNKENYTAMMIQIFEEKSKG